MSAEHFAGFIHKISFTRYVGMSISNYEPRMIVIGDKPYLLRILLMSNRYPRPYRYRPYLVLCQSSERENGMSQLFLCEHVEHIGLIFGLCRRSFDRVSSVIKSDYIGIVSRSDPIRIKNREPAHHPVPFNVSVTDNTGIWRYALYVFADKRLRYIFFKIRRTVKCMIWYVYRICSPSRIIYLAAPAFFRTPALPCTQSNPYHLMAGFLKKICRHSTVNAAGHTDDHL